VRRYKRFLADVILPSGARVTMHCPNTGAMTGCATPGSRVWYSTSANSTRKYAHTLEIIETEQGDRVGVNSARANAVVAEALAAGRIDALQSRSWTREVAIPDASGRFDFLLQTNEGLPCFVEVKSVTLKLDGDSGGFPDAVSARARRHVAALAQVCAMDVRAALLFCVQHTGIRRVRPADHVDPAYGDALRAAVAGGVEVLAYGCAVTPTGIEIERRLPVELSTAQ
jgi:sugar fermentation stimulation protein A